MRLWWPTPPPRPSPATPERPGLAAGPPDVELLPGAGALGAEPRSPVAKIDAHMRAVQVGLRLFSGPAAKRAALFWLLQLQPERGWNAPAVHLLGSDRR